MSDKYVCESCVKEPVGSVNVARVIARLDECFSKNDMVQAGETLSYWENEAKRLGDDRGLLSVLNEELGYYRKTRDKENGLRVIRETEELLQNTQCAGASTATILVNLATTMKAFGMAQDALPYYEKAQSTYEALGKNPSYEYAALLNNRALAYEDLKDYDKACQSYEQAIEILKNYPEHDGEIAVSLMNLAHAVFDNDDTAYEKVEALLDSCWEYLNSDNIIRNADYAQILMKCAPSFRYFKREIEADALEEVAKEIYNEAKK